MPAEESISTEQFEQFLLSHGGSRVVGHEGDPDLAKIVTRGRALPGKDPIMMPGSPSQCHSNVCALHEANPGVKVHTGYALSDDDIWRPHSWATHGRKVVETTEARTKYVGFPLRKSELEEFKYEND